MDRNLLITISYRGSNYHGFQVQKNALTICEVFQKTIESILGHKVDIKGCSRTDTGVHANMYCISVKTLSLIKCDSLIKALNRILPPDISVLNCQNVNIDFHARYNCVKKTYIYKIWNAPYKNPFLGDITYHYKYPLNCELLNKQAKDFIGQHDFKAFCNYKKNSTIEVTIRTIYDFCVYRDEDMVIFKVCGDGFLYNMVRIMVGTLIFMSEGKINEKSIPSIIKSKNRENAGKTIPAKGLYLDQVYYN